MDILNPQRLQGWLFCAAAAGVTGLSLLLPRLEPQTELVIIAGLILQPHQQPDHHHGRGQCADCGDPGHPFRFEAGRDSDMMPATVHGMIPAALAAPGFIEHHRGSCRFGLMARAKSGARQVWRRAGATGRGRCSPSSSSGNSIPSPSSLSSGSGQSPSSAKGFGISQGRGLVGRGGTPALASSIAMLPSGPFSLWVASATPRQIAAFMKDPRGPHHAGRGCTGIHAGIMQHQILERGQFA